MPQMLASRSLGLGPGLGLAAGLAAGMHGHGCERRSPRTQPPRKGPRPTRNQRASAEIVRHLPCRPCKPSASRFAPSMPPMLAPRQHPRHHHWCRRVDHCSSPRGNVAHARHPSLVGDFHCATPGSARLYGRRTGRGTRAAARQGEEHGRTGDRLLTRKLPGAGRNPCRWQASGVGQCHRSATRRCGRQRVLRQRQPHLGRYRAMLRQGRLRYLVGNAPDLGEGRER